jgi:hypothetical protein
MTTSDGNCRQSFSSFPAKKKIFFSSAEKKSFSVPRRPWFLSQRTNKDFLRLCLCSPSSKENNGCYHVPTGLAFSSAVKMPTFRLQLSSLKKVSMPYIRGYEEDGFMKQLDVSRQDLEILAPDKVSRRRRRFEFQTFVVKICDATSAMYVVHFENKSFFSIAVKNALSYYNTAVEAVNSKVVGLGPGANPTTTPAL